MISPIEMNKSNHSTMIFPETPTSSLSCKVVSLDPTPIDLQGMQVVKKFTCALEIMPEDVPHAKYWLLPLLKEELMEVKSEEGDGGSNGSFERSSMWKLRFQELCEYRERHGNCSVPADWIGNHGLAKWVKRQRYQYKLKKEERYSTLTRAREATLYKIGFHWKLHQVLWAERFEDLLRFKQKFGHCCVPAKFSASPTLAIWVQSQRRQYKLVMRKESSHMTVERVKKLNSVSFEWEPRSGFRGHQRVRYSTQGY
jgi:hypothetical protein